MRLDSKYYSFCREIGLMKENYGHQHALDAIKREVKNAAADPAYVALVDKLTFFYVKKSKKAKGYWDKLFIKNPKKSMLSALMPSILIAAFTFVSMIIVFVGGAK